MPGNNPYVCVPCREVFKGTTICPKCRQPMQPRSSKWRAPKRNNNKAWKLVESGDWLWDKSDPRVGKWSEWVRFMRERESRVNPKMRRSS